MNLISFTSNEKIIKEETWKLILEKRGGIKKKSYVVNRKYITIS